MIGHIDDGDGAEDEPVVRRPGRLRRMGSRFLDLMNDKPAGRYSTLAPRKADGEPGPIIPFNGNGMSR